MTDVAALIADMVRAGVDPDLIGRAAAALAERDPIRIVDEQAERRRAADRERKRLRNSAESAETDLEKETLPHTPTQEKTNTPSDPKGSSAPKAKRGTRLPADWFLPDDFRAEALRLGLPEHLIDAEAAKMSDWSRSSKNGAKLDWLASWRNWVRSAIERLPNARGSPAQSARRLNLADAFGAIREAKEAHHGHQDRETVSSPVLYLPTQRG